MVLCGYGVLAASHTLNNGNNNNKMNKREHIRSLKEASKSR